MWRFHLVCWNLGYVHTKPALNTATGILPSAQETQQVNPTAQNSRV